jgi:type II secretory pathway predicted ATPase ExeA
MALGVPTDTNATYVQLFAQFQDLLIEEYAAGRRTMLIFDEAQNLSIETLEELRMFSHINADKDELIQLVLIGQPELRDLIGQPRLTQFAQRVAAEYHLPAMSAASVQAYINHRLGVAGATREIFTPAACECVHLASRGVPRLVNQICDYALVYAFTDGLDKVDASVIEQVVTDRRAHGNLKMMV